jgi:hypothetical protein
MPLDDAIALIQPQPQRSDHAAINQDEQRYGQDHDQGPCHFKKALVIKQIASSLS